MVECGIIFDSIRPEEKMLYKEAKSSGITAKLINAKGIKLWDSGISIGEGATSDIYLQRCVSYFRSLHITKAIESFGLRVVNSFNAALVCGNKFFTTLALSRAGIPTPKTVVTFTKESAMQAMSEMGYPGMLKPVMGSWGRLIAPLNDPESTSAIIESREHMHPVYQVYYLQERVKRPPRDIRSLVVGDELVCAIYRYQPEMDWRTNTARGGRAEACPKSGELEDLSLRAAKVVEGDIVGVDCMETDGRLLVHEVNNTVEFKNMVRVTGVNIPASILGYLKDRSRK